MRKIVTFGVVLAAALTLVGCEKVENAGRKVARKTGSVVGKGATEFFSGVGEGIKTVADGNVPDVLTAIATRKSVRKFDPLRAVEDEKVEKILKAAMCAPSAMDKRPWEFVVVKDKAQLQKLGERLPYSRVANGAQLAIVVCGSLDNGLPGRGKEYWIHDCSAASMNILLAAHGLGLGAVWTGVFPGEERIAIVREIPHRVDPGGYAGIVVAQYILDPSVSFESVQTLKEGSVDGRLVTMCHYPMLSYPQARRGYMVYGHIHNNTGDDYWPLIMRRPRMLNAGVDVNNFEPVAFDELLANNQAFQRCHADTAKANPFDLYCAEA